jgi:hypothetical protein
MTRRGAILMMAAVLILVAGVSLAETLVQVGAEGSLQPGVASEWSATGASEVTFRVRAGWAEGVKKALDDKLGEKGAVIVLADEQTVVVSGLAPEQVYKLVAEIDIPVPAATTSADPLAGMLAGNSAPLFAAPDGSSSVRVAGDMDEQEFIARQFVAKVVRVDHSQGFPYSRLTVSIETPPIKALKGVVLKQGELVVIVPFFAHTSAPGASPGAQFIDTNDANTRINIGAWFLKAGDLVMVVPSGRGEKGAVNVSSVQRKY